MLKQTSKNFKKYFLLEFTKELIRATDTYKNIRIEGEVKSVIHEKPEKQVEPVEQKSQLENFRKDVKEVIHEKMKRDSKIVSELKKEEQPFIEFLKNPQPLKQIQHPPIPARPLPPLQIPEPVLPPTVQYLRPTPTPIELDLGKLNSLIRDPLVKIIECNGPDTKVIVMGTMGRKPTKITLNKEEIDSVIRRFSEATKIPVEPGIFRAVRGRLIFSAIVSEVVGSKFIIKKMSNPYFYGIRS